MGRKKLNMVEKTTALTLLGQGTSAISVAAELKVSRQAIYDFKKAAATPSHKPGSGRKRLTSLRMDMMLKREVTANPSITAASLRKRHPKVLKNVAIRTIQHRLRKDLDLPLRLAAKKPLLTDAMRKKRIAFCKKYRDWTSDQWKSVMFSVESIFRLVRETSKTIRRPTGSDRYDPKFTVKTVNHPSQVMVWGAFSGKGGRGGLYLLHPNVTMRRSNYVNVLRDHMLTFFDMHRCSFFYAWWGTCSQNCHC